LEGQREFYARQVRLSFEQLSVVARMMREVALAHSQDEDLGRLVEALEQVVEGLLTNVTCMRMANGLMMRLREENKREDEGAVNGSA
jgi:hypothetical protein